MVLSVRVDVFVNHFLCFSLNFSFASVPDLFWGVTGHKSVLIRDINKIMASVKFLWLYIFFPSKMWLQTKHNVMNVISKFSERIKNVMNVIIEQK